MKPFISVFEGLDRTGKTTQINRVYSFIKKNYPEVVCIQTKDPGGTDFGKEIRNILLHKDVDFQTITEYFLFVADRYENIHQQILQQSPVKDNTIILYDRSHFSSFAYQVYPILRKKFKTLNERKFLGIDKQIGKLLFSLYNPNIIFYFKKRISENSQSITNPDKIEKRSNNYFNAVAQGYEKGFHYYKNFRNRVIPLFFEDGIERNEEKIIGLLSKLFLEKIK